MKVFHWRRFFWPPVEVAGVRLPLGASFLRRNGSVRAKNQAGVEVGFPFREHFLPERVPCRMVFGAGTEKPWADLPFEASFLRRVVPYGAKNPSGAEKGRPRGLPFNIHIVYFSYSSRTASTSRPPSMPRNSSMMSCARSSTVNSLAGRVIQPAMPLSSSGMADLKQFTPIPT